MSKISKYFRNGLTGFADNLFLRESKNIDHWRQKQALEETGRFVEENLPMVNSFDSRYAIFCHAAGLVEHGAGMICEFGVAGGKSINYLAKLLPTHRLYGFDTFEGLPQDWRANAPKGTFRQKSLPVVASNVELVCGLFDQSLPGFLEKHPEPMLLLHVDCDLYQSARTVFELTGERIRPGTIIIFDEFFNYPGWMEGEFKAFMEYVHKASIKFTFIGYARTGTQIAIQIL